LSQNPLPYTTLLRQNRDFRYLWLGQIISLLGDWFNLIAAAALVGTLTRSGFAVGGLFIVRMLAPFLISPLAGVVADRYDRKYVLIASDLARGAIVLLFLTVRRPEHVWLLYVFTGLQLGTGAFFFASRNAILPEIVSKQALGTANALTSATWSVMLAVGAALGGIAAGTIGIYPAFILDAFTFLLSAVCIARVRSHPRSGGGKSLRDAYNEYREGLSYLRRHTDTTVLALHKTAIGLYSGGLDVLLVAVCRDVFPLGRDGSLTLGLVFGIAGVGSGLGPILARRLTGDVPRLLRLAILPGYALGTVGLLVMAPLDHFGGLLAGAFLRSFGGGIVWVFSTQLLLQTVPDRVRGRVFSSEFALFTLGAAAGAAGAGQAQDLGLDPTAIFGVLAIIPLVPAALWLGWIRRTPHQKI
jgi:MFS family permease